MKKIVLLSFVVCALFLTGCIEVTDEITLKDDGSGVATTTNDMSTLISLLKGMGGADALGGLGDKATDTTVSMASMADSVSSLTADEKTLVKKGKLGVVVNVKDEKMITRVEMPFSKIAEVDKIKAISSKISAYFISKNMGGGMPAGLGEKMPAADPISDYFVTTYAKGLIEKKLNKEKYAGVESDEVMKGLKEMADNGMSGSNIIIINLPTPAKSATGKNLTLSEDKKKVTIKSSTEDFFDNGTALEFKIEY